MKPCPVCGALAFDDAPMCYGCLHPFLSDEEADSPGESTPSGMPITPQPGALAEAPATTRSAHPFEAPAEASSETSDGTSPEARSAPPAETPTEAPPLHADTPAGSHASAQVPCAASSRSNLAPDEAANNTGASFLLTIIPNNDSAAESGWFCAVTPLVGCRT